MKDRIPISLRSSVVYSIPCSGCDRKYIGQTSQFLKKRITQHKSDIRVGKFKFCALAAHTHTTGHSFNYDEVRILASEPSLRSRLLLESFFINKDKKNAVNFKADTDNVSIIYSYLFHVLSGLWFCFAIHRSPSFSFVSDVCIIVIL